jgi:hypothetical protein
MSLSRQSAFREAMKIQAHEEITLPAKPSQIERKNRSQ